MKFNYIYIYIYIYRRIPKRSICRDSNGLDSEALTCLQMREEGMHFVIEGVGWLEGGKGGGGTLGYREG